MAGKSSPPDASQPFSRKRVVWMAIVCSISIALTLVLSARPESREPTVSCESDSFSKSAVGYRALRALLEASGVRVVSSQLRSSTKVDASTPLLIMEPHEADETSMEAIHEMVEDALDREAPVVLVLPKWVVSPSHSNPGWIEDAKRRDPSHAQQWLGQVTGIRPQDASVVHVPTTGPFAGELATDGQPLIPGAQLIQSSAKTLVPLIASGEGILVAQVVASNLYVVADPDLLNTAGLSKGDNAVIAHRLIVDRLRAHTVVIDETCHGYRATPSLAGELFSYPLALVSLHVLGLFAMVLWASMGRFGAPKAVGPRMPPGKLGLVDNTAELIALGGYSAHSLQQYAQLTLRECASACGLAAGDDEEAQVRRVDDVAHIRGLAEDWSQLRRRVDAVAGKRNMREVVATAKRLHQFRREMTHGHG